MGSDHSTIEWWQNEKGLADWYKRKPAHLKVFPYRSTIEWWQNDKGLADWAQYQHT